MSRTRPALHYVKGILWKPTGSEVGPAEPRQATPDDPLVLLLRRNANHYRPQDDGDLPGGGVHTSRGENPVDTFWRELRTETGLSPVHVGSPVLVWANVIDDRRGTAMVNVVHSVYAAQVALDAEVAEAPFQRPYADNHGADWVLLSRAIGETSIPSLAAAMQWTYDRQLWQQAEAP
jgi:ADP-ribose pyrophosphatase YjhB (NUDIX family)